MLLTVINGRLLVTSFILTKVLQVYKFAAKTSFCKGIRNILTMYCMVEDVASFTEERPRTAFNRQVSLQSTFTRKCSLINENIPDGTLTPFWEAHFVNNNAVSWAK